MRPTLIAAFALTTLAAAPLCAQAKLRLMSNDVHAGAKIADTYVFNGMDCSGKNISPELHWTGAPAKTKSFALTVYDPDAPTGSGWWHWVTYNIPASAKSFPQGAGDKAKNLLPAGTVMGNGDAGSAGYQGPCPPKGDKSHRYIFSLYALDVDHLDVPAGASAAYVGFNIHGHQLAKTTLTAMYGR